MQEHLHYVCVYFTNDVEYFSGIRGRELGSRELCMPQMICLDTLYYKILHHNRNICLLNISVYEIIYMDTLNDIIHFGPKFGSKL